jgi:Txe/YoeB family toxin of toxin-antitoxin system
MVKAWKIVYTTQAKKDAKKVKAGGLQKKVQGLLEIIAKNPLQTPPAYEKLIGDLVGAYSRRINIQHRLVYQIIKDAHTVKVIRMWTHYR